MEECKFDSAMGVLKCTVHDAPMTSLCTNAAQALQNAHREAIDHLCRVSRVLGRHQPVGSPPPGDVERLAEWVLSVLQRQVEEAERERDERLHDRIHETNKCIQLGNRLASLEDANAKLLVELRVAAGILDEVEAQWGDDYLWKKWGLPEHVQKVRDAALAPCTR